MASAALPSVTIGGNTAYMNPGIVAGSITMPQLGAPMLQYPPTYTAPTTFVDQQPFMQQPMGSVVLPTTSSMVAYPSYGLGQSGPFTFYATDTPAPAPAPSSKPADASPAAKPAAAAAKPAAAKKDAKAAKKKKRAKKCGCC